MRRELREAKAKLKEASLAPPQPKAPDAVPTKLDEARAAVPKPLDDPEPDRAKDPETWRDWKIRDNDRWRATVEAERKVQAEQQQRNELTRAAVDELRSLETDFIKDQPDYFDAAKFGRQKYAEAMRIMHPEMNDRQLGAEIDFKIMEQASKWAQRGLNAAEEFYDLCIEKFGYVPAAKVAAKPQVEEEAEPEEETESAEDRLEALANQHRGLAPAKAAPPVRPKPSLKQISASRRRSASPLQGPGQGGRASITKEAAVEMTMAEFAELSPADLADLEAMGE